MKCGNCQKNKIANSTHAPSESEPRAAAQPISGGSAPGMAPTAVERVVRVFSGVYSPRYKHRGGQRHKHTQAHWLTPVASHASAKDNRRSHPKISTSRGWSTPDGSGRAAVPPHDRVGLALDIPIQRRSPAADEHRSREPCATSSSQFIGPSEPRIETRHGGDDHQERDVRLHQHDIRPAPGPSPKNALLGNALLKNPRPKPA